MNSLVMNVSTAVKASVRDIDRLLYYLKNYVYNRDGKRYTTNFKLASIMFYMFSGSEDALQNITTCNGTQMLMYMLRRRDAYGKFAVPREPSSNFPFSAAGHQMFQSITQFQRGESFEHLSCEDILTKLATVLSSAKVCDEDGNYFAPGYVLATALTYMRSGSEDDLMRITTAGYARFLVMELRLRFQRSGFDLFKEVKKFQ